MTQKNYKKGFTLVEMLVASAIFTVFMVVAVGALMSIISANDRAQAIKTVIDNVTFAVDDMARNIRSGTNYQSCNDTTQIGLNQTGTNCSSNQGNELSYFDNGDPQDSIYYRFASNQYLSSGQGNILEICNGSDCTIPKTWQSLTAPTSTVNISNMTFYVFNGSGVQPRVLMTVTGFIPNKNGASTEFDIQTTASQRERN
jgi:prepilin-type N-terminal cleavage/methylation domain-containing protein